MNTRKLSWCLLSASLVGTGVLHVDAAHAGSIVTSLKKARFELRRLGCRHQITQAAHKTRMEKGHVFTYCINCGEFVKARSHYLYPELFNFVEFEGGLSMEETDELRKQYGKK